MDMQVTETGNGRLVVTEAESGHTFEFRLATARGAQILDAMVPIWANGREPTSTQRYTIEAREAAEREAADLGWLET